MWQKYYTPPVLPLRDRPNRGELPKYYCEGTQEAIISRKDFDAVQKLMKEREEKHYKRYRTEKKFFLPQNNMQTLRLDIPNERTTKRYIWSCSRKGMIGGECHARSYSDEDFYRAFIKL